MHRSKHIVLLSSILLVASLFFTMAPLASTAFAATNGMHTASKASTLFTASSHLAPDSCPPTCANPINPCPPSQQSGDNNDWVKVIQFRLNALDNAKLGTDGIFGQNTKNAVIAFQNEVGITGGGGAVGDRTWSAMGFCRGFEFFFGDFGTTSTNCPPDQSEGSNDLFVNAIQALLNLDFDNTVFSNKAPDDFHPFLGFDGIFGQDTKAAVINFQQAAGISGGGGVVGQRTWSALGMCF